MLIYSANEMKHEAHGTQRPRHIDKIGEAASTAQRSDLLVQPINQRFPNIPCALIVVSLSKQKRLIRIRNELFCSINSIQIDNKQTIECDWIADITGKICHANHTG